MNNLEQLKKALEGHEEAIIILSLGALSNKNIWLKTKYKSVKVIADGHIIYNWENQ